jgi:hypothetical protein
MALSQKGKCTVILSKIIKVDSIVHKMQAQESTFRLANSMASTEKGKCTVILSKSGIAHGSEEKGLRYYVCASLSTGIIYEW